MGVTCEQEVSETGRMDKQTEKIDGGQKREHQRSNPRRCPSSYLYR